MFRLSLTLAAAACLAWSVAGHAAEPAPALDPYQQVAATVLPSTNTGWGRLVFDAARSYLFIARRADGLTVFDVRGNKVVANVPGTAGASDVVLLPQFDRAYVANDDGTLTTIALSTLTLIKWEKIADAGLNAIGYELGTGRVYAVAGARAQSSSYIALDARTGQPAGRADFAGSRMDKPAGDGQGALYAPQRDKARLLKLSAKDLNVEQSWPLGPCEQPVAVDYDQAGKRVFIGCRGEKPVLAVLDPATGKVVAVLPIGKGVDGLVFDPDKHLLITANGADANMTVIRQLDPDRYQLVETISTRPKARVLALDPATKHLYSVAAGFTLAAPEPGQPAPAPVFHSDSFTVLSYGRVHQMTEREMHDLEDEHEH